MKLNLKSEVILKYVVPIVTGALLRTGTDVLYIVIGWSSLSERKRVDILN